jgi:hypothetical protein
MKKALIAALLVVSAAFAPCLPNVAEFPDPTSELARATASPLFWQFWDEPLSRELAQWIQTASDDGQESEWPPELLNALMCLYFQVFLKYALEGSLSAAGKNDRICRVDSKERHSSYCRVGISTRF